MTNKKRFLFYIFITIAVLANLVPGVTKPANALNPLDYFTFSYDIALDTQEVHTYRFFYATVTGQATCTKDLPLTPTEAYITGRVVARHIESGSRFTLNAGYTVTLDSFPTKEGETFQATQEVPLFFPSGSPPGVYELIGELVEARFKAVLWFTVTQYLPQYEPIGRVVFLPSASSSDGACTISFSDNSTARNSSGNPLTEITFINKPPLYPPPYGYFILGDIYDIGPAGATFSPPASLTIEYNDSLIPPTVSENRLVIASYNESNNQWNIFLQSSVNEHDNNVSIPISHLSLYAVLSPVEPLPASFTLSDMVISPVEVKEGEAVSVSITVFNSGELEGEYEVVLKLNGEVFESQLVTLAGGSSKLVTFNITSGSPDDYSVDINGLTGSFVVYNASFPLPASFTLSNLVISPVEVKESEAVSVSITVQNSGELEGEYEVVLKLNGEVFESQLVILAGGSSKLVTFSITGGSPDDYSVDINGLTGSFIVKATEPHFAIPDDLKKESDWLSLFIYALDILLLVFIFILARRWLKSSRTIED